MSRRESRGVRDATFVEGGTLFGNIQPAMFANIGCPFRKFQRKKMF
jgi:hypothetical protein